MPARGIRGIMDGLAASRAAAARPFPAPMYPPATALIVVDLQPDFMPGGALPCHQGDAIVPAIDALLRSGTYRTVVATQDWHPRGHASFASSHPGRQPFDSIALHGHPQTLWPDHCVQGSAGAALDPRVQWDSVDLVLRKGSSPQVDSYSAFQENHGPDGVRPPTGLAGWLRERGITEVHVCGLARDYCVLWTAQDARAAGFQVGVLWDLSRPVSPEGDAPTRAALEAAGIAILLPQPQSCAPADDPPPQPPEKPLPAECCESGCPICVYDLYAEALDEYRQALAAWQQRHPDAGGGNG